MRGPQPTAIAILVVDDDISAANALGRLLRTFGHAVRVVYDSLEGLELAGRMRPDLVLHDILLPQMDGYEAARRLRAQPALSRTLLIACSASIDGAKARAAGFDGWLEKPIRDTELDTVLQLVQERLDPTRSNSGSDAVRPASE
jgi:CheY-like chemotaxis protein